MNNFKSIETVDAMWERIEKQRAKRAADMPTEQDALNVMFSAYQRLKELGWNDAIYCPKNGSIFASISAGSTGIHDCSYQGEWPKGSWWTYEAGDMWPAQPILFKLKALGNE